MANGGITPAMYSSRTSGIWVQYGLRSDLRAPNFKKIFWGSMPSDPPSVCVASSSVPPPSPNLKHLPPPLNCFCLCLQTVGLISQAGSFLFRSADRFQYSYLICDLRCRGNGKGLARETYLSFRETKKVTSWQAIGHENNV